MIDIGDPEQVYAVLLPGGQWERIKLGSLVISVDGAGKPCEATWLSAATPHVRTTVAAEELRGVRFEPGGSPCP